MLGPGKYVVLSDIQWPSHNAKALRAVLAFIREYKPDGVLNVGDELDSPQVSRWSKGYAEEYSATLQKDIDGLREWTGHLRDALDSGSSTRGALGDKPIHVSRSNHVDRLEKYIRQYAPALSGLRSLDIINQLGYPELGITYHRRPFEFAPGWVLAHGDEGSLSRNAGFTALGLAKKWGVSVVCGHTHRAGITHYTMSLNGRSRQLTGFEVGNLMDVHKASYLKAGSADWQQGFGLLHIDDRRRVTPAFVPVRNGQIQGDWR